MENQEGARGTKRRRKDSTHHSWTSRDEEKLRMGVGTYNHQWDLVCKKMFGDSSDITPNKCSAKWQQLLRGMLFNELAIQCF